MWALDEPCASSTATEAQYKCICTRLATCCCLAVLDNLVKGAAGQAMQNLNIMMGQPEETALMQQAMFP